MKKPLLRMLWWLSVAPLGKPVVPLVYWMLIASSNCVTGSSASAPAISASHSSEPRYTTCSSAGRSPRTSSIIAA